MGIATAVVAAVVPCSAGAQPVPTDPSYAQQTGALSILRFPQALGAIGTRQLQPVLVAAIDTGVDLDHPDLAASLFSLPQPVSMAGVDGGGGIAPAGGHGWDFIGAAPPSNYGALGTGDSDPEDIGGHGTLVTGVMAQVSNNGVGGAAIAPNARILAIRSCWVNDECPQYIQDDAFNFATARGARVATLSWNGDLGGGGAAGVTGNPNMLIVSISGGNGGANQIASEASCNINSPNVLCVTTSSPTDGLDCGEYDPSNTDLAVPTRQNFTTALGGGFTPTGCATSFASPTAGGAAAFLFGIDPTASPADVKAALVDSARTVPAWTGKSVSGGVLDMEAAVKLFAQRRGITLTPDANAPPPPPPPPPPGDRTKPRLGASLVRSTLTISLSEPATVTMRISRRLGGRRVNRRCVIPTRANRRRPRCTRLRSATTLTIRGVKAGATRRTFTRRDARGRRLPKGSYQASVTARDSSGSTSAARILRFSVG